MQRSKNGTVNRVLDPIEDALLLVYEIQNYEQTIKKYIEKFEAIRARCNQQGSEYLGVGLSDG